MAALIITNVLSSSVDIQYNYLDTEELFSYGVKGTYQIDVSDINIVQNETSLLSGRDAIESVYNRPNITARIGADEYINGKVTNYNFEAGSLVGSETVSITIEESRRLDSYAGTQFAKYIPNPHALGSFSESYTFSRNGSDYSSDRKIEISYNQEAGGQFLNNAKTFLNNFYFDNRPNFGYQEDGISENAKINANFRGLISETYDLINLSVSLSEKVDSSLVDTANNVSRKEKVSLKIDEKGFLEKTFTIDLKSLRLDSENTLKKATASIVDRKIVEEGGQFGKPFSVSKGFSTDGNNASLTISFSTDPKKSQENSISYSGDENKAEKFIEYTLKIAYVSDGKNKIEKFSNAKASWIGEQGEYNVKIKRLFHPQVAFHEKSRSTNFQKSEGRIEESVVYTTDDSYKASDDGLLKLKKTISKTRQIKRIEKFLSLQNLQDQVVQSDLKTVGQASVNAEATVSQSMGLYKAKEILESKTSEFNDLVNEGVIHITSDVITLNVGDGKASRQLQYLFLSS
tara:strand:+ start:5157 stop:6704 length:1548 start_codon:yes stop_codon:yes gene_type:complete